MPDVLALPWRKPTGLAARLMWPIAAILAAAFGLVVATAVWVSDGANRIALERQLVQVSNIIEDDAENRARQLASMTVADDIWMAKGQVHGPRLLETMAEHANSFFGFDGTYVIDRDLRAISGAPVAEIGKPPSGIGLVMPVASEMYLRIEGVKPTTSRRTATVATPRDLAFGRLAFHDGRLFVVVAAPLAPSSLSERGDWLVAVAYKELTAGVLATISTRHDIATLRLVTGRPDSHQLQLPVNDIQGRPRAQLSWYPFRPGDVMREKLIPVSLVVLAGAILFSGFVFLHVQRLALDVARSEERTRQLVGHDPLSGLPNRMPFTQRLDQELSRIVRGDEGLAVHFLDLDKFKDVNDTYGHGAGDELIKAVARRLSNLLRGADTLARFGGDEFAIIQTGVRQSEDVEALARRILSDLTVPFDVAGTQVQIGVSIGISLAPDNGMDREQLMRLADTALYQAKNEGRNRYCFFERQMDETLKLRKVVEDDLRNAIVNDELALYYQPQLSADGETIVGVEALIRWPHPKRGMISPAQFIPVAEERGLIIPLGEWVLRRACEDGRRWPGLRVAVNVSPIQFRQKDFVDTVIRIVEETGFDPSRLELELTEGVVVDDADAAEAAMIELRANGIHLALDDFGTGYSSLIYLRRFAFDKIKIDRSFLESMEATGESAILVHSMVHLGRALGLTVTAEGVETVDQHRFLQAVGCHELQGYLFSRPVTAAEIDAKLAMRQGPGEAGSAIAAA